MFDDRAALLRLLDEHTNISEDTLSLLFDSLSYEEMELIAAIMLPELHREELSEEYKRFPQLAVVASSLISLSSLMMTSLMLRNGQISDGLLSLGATALSGALSLVFFKAVTQRNAQEREHAPLIQQKIRAAVMPVLIKDVIDAEAVVISPSRGPEP